jgi:hypothetical protein
MGFRHLKMPNHIAKLISARVHFARKDDTSAIKALSLSGMRTRGFKFFVTFLLQMYRVNVKSDGKWGSRPLKALN